jgi:acetyl esterase/lipase
MHKPTFGILSILSLVFALDTLGETPKRINEIVYAQVDGHELLLDLHLPSADDPPLVVWVHGGAWRGGSRSRMPLGFLVKEGYAVASVDYRLSGTAPFPAQIHDCKAAIRFLRTNQRKYGFDGEHIAVVGSSAGGHLVAEIGVTNGHRQLEGTVGTDMAADSEVQAIVDYYGPTNFMTILDQSTPHGLGVRVPALEMLLGGRPEKKREIATLASPVFHVDENDPPLLLIHGDQDPQVPINQSHELHAKYKAKNLDVTFEVVHGGQHGGKLFFDDSRKAMVKAFLDRTIMNPKKDRPTSESK